MMDYRRQPAPAYSSLPPPPPFESAPPLTTADSQNDLTSMESNHSYGAAAMDSPVSATGYSTPAYPGTPQKINPNLDSTKFKTKVCRHYLMGNRCPFEERCAFAHSHEEARANRAAAEANKPAPPAYFDNFPSGSSGPSSDAGADVDTPPYVMPEPQDNSRSSTPPSYPSKYRYDPYNVHTCVVYAA